MSATHRHCGFFLLRSPALPVAALQEITDHGVAARASNGGAEQGISFERAAVRERVQSWMADPGVREAIRVASPSLFSRLAAGGAREDVALSALRYLARMASRPTPFGLFAATTTGRIGARSVLRLAARDRWRRCARLDARAVAGMYRAALAVPSVRRAARLEPNTSLYEAGGRWRFAASRPVKGGVEYDLVAVEKSGALDLALATLRDDGATIDSLARTIAAAEDVSFEDAAEFVNELVATQVVTFDLAPPLTGQDPLATLRDRLAAIDDVALAPLRSTVADVESSLAQIDRSPPGGAVEALDRLDHALDAAALRDEESGCAVQVDLVAAPLEATLSEHLARELLRGVSLLSAVAPSYESALAAFRPRFVARFGEREVSLLAAVDPECGVPFGASEEVDAGVDDLERLLPARQASAGRTFGERDAALLALVSRALRDGADRIELDDAAVESLASRAPLALPEAFSVLATIAGSPAALHADEVMVHLKSVAAPSAANLLARFVHADDALAEAVHDLMRAEQARSEGAPLCEVVHQPREVVGNVTARPVLRDFEIVFLGGSGAAKPQRILASDLLLSVQSGRFVLRSRSLGRVLVPRLTTAHNFMSAKNLAAYQLLCALQQDEGTAMHLKWDWGCLSTAPFLPRVSSGRLLLSPARWRVEAADLPVRADAAGLAALGELRSRLRLPRRVLLSEGDNELPLDLESIVSLEWLLRAARRGKVTLTETAGSAAAPVACEDGDRAAEIVVPFVSRTPRPAIERAPRATVTHAASLPGSDWLYLKAYTGASEVDRVLVDRIAPVLRGRPWFFVRYRDPEPHVRVRVRGPRQELWGDVLPRLHDALAEACAQDLVARVQLDTYEPEEARYGGAEGVRLCEAVFCADASLAVAIAQETAASDPFRAHVALVVADAYLEAFGLDAAARYTLVDRWCEGLRGELEAPTELLKAIGARYRAEHDRIWSLLRGRAGDPEWSARPGLEPLLQEVSARVQEVRRGVEDGRVVAVGAHVAGSLVHMSMNRLLAPTPRRREALAYEVLRRFYAEARRVAAT